MLSLKSLRGDKDEAPNVEATKSVVQNEDTSDVICGIKDETIKDGIALISLSGDIDATTAPIITTRIKEILGSENLTKLTFNLADVRYLSSAGLRSFVEVQNICLEKNIDFKSIELSEKVYRLFKVTGFGSMLKLEMNENLE
ncbi:STAS domain-containing protein [Agathobacter rectalis]|jgi:anti-sigma B factor antagonist|uniref:STAS domain-containing protein n=1 Tax=Agathobacter rectalis TaxID=39491 RepID=UPI0027D1F067|nr:STAS domain-containing protein [Agathobacter rectalis]MCB7108292.1 STAS domain-containing protein [Agathobacter rectalis]MCG4811830.1 STAS domain-containing protein [Agathobacter rectalis]